MDPRGPGAPGTGDLRGDCARCVGLCCVVPAFAASADFALEKPAGTPCPHLRGDFGCGIHAQLRERGFHGCTVYDCFGAGQRVTRVAFGRTAPENSGTGTSTGTDWRRTPAVASRAFAAFEVVRALHELLWYVAAALELDAAAPLHGELRTARDEVDALAGSVAGSAAGSPAGGGADVDTVRDAVNGLLRRASALVRGGVRGPGGGPGLRGAMLLGADLRGRDLRAADLRGAVLVGADLRGADLAAADLTGADLRGARVHDGGLREALFVTPGQLASLAPAGGSPGRPAASGPGTRVQPRRSARRHR